MTAPNSRPYCGADVRVESRPGPWGSQRERPCRDPRDARFRSSKQEYSREQADLSAEQPPSRQGARLPQAHEHSCRPGGPRLAPSQGPRPSRRLRCYLRRTGCGGVRISPPQSGSVRAAATGGWSSTTVPASQGIVLRRSSASSCPRSRLDGPPAVIGSSAGCAPSCARGSVRWSRVHAWSFEDWPGPTAPQHELGVGVEAFDDLDPWQSHCGLLRDTG